MKPFNMSDLVTCILIGYLSNHLPPLALPHEHVNYLVIFPILSLTQFGNFAKPIYIDLAHMSLNYFYLQIKMMDILN
jgi:hypothetical protein